MRRSKATPIAVAALALSLAVAGCRAPGSVDLPLDFGDAGATVSPTAPVLPPEPSLLVVCLNQEPASLYLYASLTPEARTILQAIYDGPFDVVDYTYEPVIIESMPSTSTGQARLEPTTVAQGSVYFNPETRLPDTLVPGQTYAPSACTGPECVQDYQGGEVSMDRWVVDFRLRPGLTWSDGEPLTAQDSVFSFNLNAQAQPPASRDLVFRTSGYEAIDDETVRWTGIPGYFDPEIAAHFWSPLPEHTLSGMAVADLPAAEASAVLPMGWGPYKIENREPGGSIRLGRNPNYAGAAEGSPIYDEVLFRFVGDDPATVVQQLLTGECDILDESAIREETWPVLLEQEGQGRIEVASAPGPRLLRADFIFDPLGAETTRPFAGAATRRALAACVDRAGWARDTFGDHGAVPATYLGTNHPMADAAISPVAYDPNSALSALEMAGWVDDDGSPETPRLARGVDGAADGTVLSWTLGVVEGGWDEAAARSLVADWAACGALVELETFPADELFAPYPEGPAFGGELGMVVWSWFGWVTPSCELFASWEIPSADRPEGGNASRFADPAFDEACGIALYATGADGAAQEAIRRTQAIFAEQLPSIPLAVYPRAAATAGTACGFVADPSASGLLWDIESLAPCEG